VAFRGVTAEIDEGLRAGKTGRMLFAELSDRLGGMSYRAFIGHLARTRKLARSISGAVATRGQDERHSRDDTRVQRDGFRLTKVTPERVEAIFGPDFGKRKGGTRGPSGKGGGG